MGEKLKTEEKKERTKANGILYHVRVVFSDSIASTFLYREVVFEQNIGFAKEL